MMINNKIKILNKKQNNLLLKKTYLIRTMKIKKSKQNLFRKLVELREK